MEARVETRDRQETNTVSPRGTLRDAAWLAGMDVRRSWVSFPVATVTALVPGFYLILLYHSAFSGSMGSFGTFLLDVWFLLVVTVLNVNFLFNRDYYYRLSEDNYTKRLSFLLGLPISPRAVIKGRAMYMALALACGAPSFFLLPYLISGDLRAALGLLDYVWFAGIWIGYALFMMGFLLFMWNGLSFQAELGWIFSIFPGGCLLVATVSNFALDDGLAMALIQVAKANGPLAATISVAVGCAALVFWIRLAERGLRRRELG